MCNKIKCNNLEVKALEGIVAVVEDTADGTEKVDIWTHMTVDVSPC